MGSPVHGGRGRVVDGAKPAAAMVSLQLLFAALQIFIKLALDDGMDARIIVAYRFMFAAMFLCPLAFLIERKKRPPLTTKILIQLFLCGLFGFTINHNLYVLAIKLTSATFVTAISNLTPAVTFILAILTRCKTLKLKKPAGQAKLLGTLVGIGGAMMFTFYKGPEITILRQLPHLRFVHTVKDYHSGSASASNPVLGSFLSIVSCFSCATWFIIQAKVAEVYPCHYSIAAIVCLFGAFQSTIVAISVHRGMENWRLGFNIRLYSSAYAGLIASGAAFPLLSWCLQKKGPVFVSMFGPLMLIFVAALSSILLDEALHLGSVLGSILIVVGVYLVLWGKAKANVGPDEELGKISAPSTTLAAGENEINDS